MSKSGSQGSIYDLVIVGAGIVGLTVAYETKKKYPNLKVLILEKEGRVAAHQTGRNSGVVHSGIYYKVGSQKALNAIRGSLKMKEFCLTNHLKYNECGKLIVGNTPNELKILESLIKQGTENGIQNLRLLNESEIREIEPNVSAKMAIHIKTAAIVDYLEVCEKIRELLSSSGVEFKFHTSFEKYERTDSNSIEIGSLGLHAKKIVICAGIYTDDILRKNLKETPADIFLVPFRGEYFNLNESKNNLINGLVYPCPDLRVPFLGVHLHKTIKGHIEAGPNAVLAFGKEAYDWKTFDLKFLSFLFSQKGFWHFLARFYKSGVFEILRSLFSKLFLRDLKLMVPKITSIDIKKGKSGIRAQAMTQRGELVDDFKIINDGNVTFILNAPSPAATASFSLAEQIVKEIF